MTVPHPHPAFCSSRQKAKGWGMSRAEYDLMVAWCEKFGDHPRVFKFLYNCPPPDTWQGTPIEWAFTEHMNEMMI